MRLFITRRCFKKIAMRFRSQPFEKPILEILQEWKYNDAIDNLGELVGVYHIVPPCLHEYFNFARVPFQDTTEQSGRQGRGAKMRPLGGLTSWAVSCLLSVEG